MDMTPEAYQRFVSERAKKSPLLKDTVLAFLMGGGICVLGQAIHNGWVSVGLDEESAGTATSCTLVALSALLTGLNLYNKLARYGGDAGPHHGFCQRRGLPRHGVPDRGACHGHGGENVHRGGAGHCVWNAVQRPLRCASDAVPDVWRMNAPGLRACHDAFFPGGAPSPADRGRSEKNSCLFR